MTNDYKAGYDAGYDQGMDEGYNDGLTDGRQENSDSAYEEGYENGKQEITEKSESDISGLIYNYNNQISDYRNTIRILKEEIYNLRKENAAITRSIPKSNINGDSQ